jgi:hypothetical protein
MLSSTQPAGAVDGPVQSPSPSMRKAHTCSTRGRLPSATCAVRA